MATTSSIPDVLDTLQTALSARSGLVGVQVVSGPLPAGDTQPESIQLDGTDGFVEWGSFGNLRRQEEYEIIGLVYIEKPGAGEDVIRSARDRAFEILGEIESYLTANHKLGGIVAASRISSIAFDQGASPSGARVARITFTVEIRNTLTKS